MPGKPYQSKLKQYEGEIRDLLEQGMSYREIAQHLDAEHCVKVTHNAIYSFANAASRRMRPKRRFYDGLDPDIKESLLKQVTAVWTHNSNAIEGNTLSLGETVQVLELGLTISGKPLKDHEEACGHAHAVDMIRSLVTGSFLDPNHLFELHRAVMPRSNVDAMNPIGAWKRDYNGTTGVVDGQMKYVEYATPRDTPVLMLGWLKEFNRLLDSCRTKEQAVHAYAWAHMSFVRVHPFSDGNGRMARLLSNLPVLRGGFPPILISSEQRARYIRILWDYHVSVGALQKNAPILPEHAAIGEFSAFILSEWQMVMDMVEKARTLQRRRSG